MAGPPQPEPAATAPEPPPDERSVASIVPISRHEPIDGVCGRIDAAPSLAVVLHAPSGNRAMSEELGMRRVARHVEASGRVFAVATRSGVLARRARAEGVPVSWNPRKVHWGSGGKVVFRLGPATLLLPPFGRYAQYVILALVVALAAAALVTAGPSATVTVYPPTESAGIVTVVRASPRVDEADLERALLPATVLTVEREVLLAVPTTGQIIRGVSSATATIRLSNPTDAAVTVPAGTIVFALPDVIAFVFDAPASVPAGGEAFASVTARSPGAIGNVPPDAINQWRTDDFADLTLTNPEAASGGADETVRAVAPADIRALEALATEIGEGSSPAILLSGAAPGYAVIGRSATLTVELGEPSASPGEATDAVFLEVRTTVEALAVAPATLEALARDRLAAANEGEVVPGAVRAVETGEEQVDHADGSYSGAMRLTAELRRGPSAADVEDAVGGRSPSSAEAEIGTRYGIEDVEIDLTPGWAPWLPRFGSRIDIQFASRAFEPAPSADAEASPTDGP